MEWLESETTKAIVVSGNAKLVAPIGEGRMETI
jgi:hypothetical protein